VTSLASTFPTYRIAPLPIPWLSCRGYRSHCDSRFPVEFHILWPVKIPCKSGTLSRAWRSALLRNLVRDLVFGSSENRGFATKLPVTRECGRKFGTQRGTHDKLTGSRERKKHREKFALMLMFCLLFFFAIIYFCALLFLPMLFPSSSFSSK